MEPALIALIGTVFAGVGLEAIKSLFSRGQKRSDEAKSMREELRKEGEALKLEASNLREEMRQIEKELDLWKEKYFVLLQQYLEIKAQLGSPKEDGDKW